MKKVYGIILFLCSIHLINCVRIEVEYDSARDMIIKGGKIYLPINLEDHPIPEQPPKAHGEEEFASGAVWWFYVFAVLCNNLFNLVLTAFAGLMSGLTVGYLSIDDLVLELRSSTGTDEEKQHACKVLPILADRHWLLVTLLLMNAFAMETLPLCLDKLVPEYLAIIISVTLVLFIGEVFPQAVCTGPDQVKIAAMVSPITRFLMLVSSPISKPLGALLDRLLGEHHKNR
jgi:metal transporter CNNM